ncbi:hypothetical protein [Nocardia africana]|uniref:Uncharacterized protein n=1 Tax=Nocardia africana TaxID=134964 RepID=A0ABW6NTA1_9NOCA
MALITDHARLRRDLYPLPVGDIRELTILTTRCPKPVSDRLPYRH